MFDPRKKLLAYVGNSSDAGILSQQLSERCHFRQERQWHPVQYFMPKAANGLYMQRLIPVSFLASGLSVLLTLFAVALLSRRNPSPVTPPSLGTAVTSEDQFATNEEALSFALEVFAAEQEQNGQWAQGTHVNAIDTTALVLLAYASTGQTHRQGKYQAVVQRGWEYLHANAITDSMHPARLRFGGRDGSPRSQALATLTICRLFAMTQDDSWHDVAQDAVNEFHDMHIGQAPQQMLRTKQHKRLLHSGKLEALRRAHFSGLTVPSDCIAVISEWQDTHAMSTPMPDVAVGMSSAKSWKDKECKTITYY